MSRFFYLMVFLGVFTVGIKAQQPGGPGAGEPMMNSGIMGRVIDSNTGDPVEYANVAIFAMPDSTLVGGTITDQKGFFRVKGLQVGNYHMRVKFIGYESYNLRNIKIANDRKVVRLKEIKLSPSNIALEGVEVTATQQEVMFKIDKRVINVSENVNAVGGSAVDALENTPGVEVDMDGNVSLRGSDNFTVLIDGKPTVMEGSEALQQIPASSIQEIELITNPSAKYDPDGLTGIINIILKKNHRGGWNGLMNASVGKNENYEAGINLNYRKKKLSITGGYNFRQRQRIGNSESYYETYRPDIVNSLGDTIYYRNEEGDRKRRRSGHTIKAGIDYDISENDLLSFNGQFQIRERYRSNDANYFTQTFFNDVYFDSVYYDTDGSNKDDETSMDFTGTYIHKFEKEDHELQVSGTYSTEDETETDYTMVDTLFNNAQIIESIYETTESHQFGTMRADYVLPLEQVKIEAGFKSSVRQIDYNQSEDLMQTAAQDAFDNQFLYTEGIHAIYAMLSGPLGGFEYKIGLRGEYSNVTTEQKATNYHNVNEIFTAYPTAHFSYELNEVNKLQLSYSRRVHRPRTWYLNPYESRSDPFLIRKGNPELDPEYANSFELNYLRYFGKSFASVTAFSRITNNSIGRVQEPIDEQKLLLTFDNINKETSSGLELSGRHQLTKWFQANVNYSFFYYTIDASTSSVSNEVKESFNHKVRANGTIRFGKSASASLFLMYFSPTVTSQGRREDFYFTGMGYKHTFFDKRLTLSARVRNPFGNFRWEFSSEGENFSNSYVRKPDMATFHVAITYRINEGIKKRRGANGNSQDFNEGMTVD